MKRYLEPKILRRGSSVMMFVKKDGIGMWLGVYHELRGKHHITKAYNGEGREYHSVSEMRISKALFTALLAEARYNSLRYKSRKEEK